MFAEVCLHTAWHVLVSDPSRPPCSGWRAARSFNADFCFLTVASDHGDDLCLACAFVSVCECVCVLPGKMHSHRGDNLVHYVLWFAAVAPGLWHRMLCHLLPTGFLMRVCDLDASSLTTVSFPLFTSVFSILITLFIALAWRILLGEGGGRGLRTLEFLANNKAAWGWAWLCGILKVQHFYQHLSAFLSFNYLKTDASSAEPIASFSRYCEFFS